MAVSTYETDDPEEKRFIGEMISAVMKEYAVQLRGAVAAFKGNVAHYERLNRMQKELTKQSQLGDGLIKSVEKYTCNAFFFVDRIGLLWDNSHLWTQNKRNPTVVMLRSIGMAIGDGNALLASEHGRFALRNADDHLFVYPTMS